MTIRANQTVAIGASIVILFCACVVALVVGAAGLGFGDVVRSLVDLAPGVHLGHVLEGVDRTVLLEIQTIPE